MLVLFWIYWLLDLLLDYREFINGVFGRYAAASSKYIGLWTVLLIAILLISIGITLCFIHIKFTLKTDL